MKAFFVRWRSARKFREYELFADEATGACLVYALEISGGMAVWQAGTLWKCPGCGDRTLRTEEFLEGLRLAEDYLHDAEAYQKTSPPPSLGEGSGMRAIPYSAALAWLDNVAAQMLGCERDRVYIQDEGTPCRYANETYVSRI